MLLFANLPGLTAAALEHDLGGGLRYHRAHALPADLPAAMAPSPIVLDLRFVVAGEDAAHPLDAWLRVHAQRATPVFVLVNTETPPLLHRVFTALKAHPGFLTVGTSSADFAPDIVIPTPIDDERRVYDALDRGASIASLTTENTDKPRIDEATIMRDRADAVAEFDDSDLEETEPATPATSAAEPVIDRPLQRAIHLHRALIALKRLK